MKENDSQIENGPDGIQGASYRYCHYNHASNSGKSHGHGAFCSGKWHLVMISLLIGYIIVDMLF